jgi:hypothetical protein
MTEGCKGHMWSHPHTNPHLRVHGCRNPVVYLTANPRVDCAWRQEMLEHGSMLTHSAKKVYRYPREELTRLAMVPYSELTSTYRRSRPT